MPDTPQLSMFGQPYQGELDVKRLQLRGVRASMPCPKCGQVWDVECVDRISHPKANVEGAVDLYGYCGSCEHEWEVNVTLRLVLEVPITPSGRTHDLKCWPEPFNAIADGTKRFEIRQDDRGFAVGDLLRLQEWDPATGEYSGREQLVHVTRIVRGEWGLPEGMVVMGIAAATDPHVQLILANASLAMLALDGQLARQAARDNPDDPIKVGNDVLEYVEWGQPDDGGEE